MAAHVNELPGTGKGGTYVWVGGEKPEPKERTFKNRGVALRQLSDSESKIAGRRLRTRRLRTEFLQLSIQAKKGKKGGHRGGGNKTRRKAEPLRTSSKERPWRGGPRARKPPDPKLKGKGKTGVPTKKGTASAHTGGERSL